MELSSSSPSTTEQMAKQKLPALPWMRDPIDFSNEEDIALDSVPFLRKRLKKALRKMGIEALFPVQMAVWIETISPGSFERDLCIKSPTGSGKTLAYALPIIQQLSTRAIRRLQALVVLPTGNSAMQVKKVFDALAPAVGLSVGLAIGQSSIADEISQLVEQPRMRFGFCHDFEDFPQEPSSKVDILIATPGRLMDHINNTRGFTLEHLNYLVVDEVDRLLMESYQSWLPNVLKLAYASDESPFSFGSGIYPPFGSLKTYRTMGVERGFKGKRHPRLAKIVLSATLTQDPSKLVQLDLHHPLLLTDGEGRYKLPKQLQSFKVVCETKHKPVYLLALLESLKGEKCIVFTSSVESTHRLYTLLGFFDGLQMSIKEYSRLQRQSIRSKTLRSFRDGETQVLISSDAMTRGMDVEGVKNVINYDMPSFIKTYIHRAGRTARARQSGCCFTLMPKDQVKRFDKMLQKASDKSCPIHYVPSESVEAYLPTYSSALERLKETIGSEKRKKHQRSVENNTGVTNKKVKI